MLTSRLSLFRAGAVLRQNLVTIDNVDFFTTERDTATSGEQHDEVIENISRTEFWRSTAEFEKLLALSKDDNVFPYKSIKKSWASVCRTAGVKGLWFRWLRDEAENRWREAGMHPLDIAYLMGHASPRTTMINNNPRREEIVRQMSAANPSKNK
jgi:hypothetical protein